MTSVKEMIIKGIQDIDNEELLQEVYILLQDIKETKQVIELNAEQKLLVEQARKDYKRGHFYSTGETFKDLLND